MAVTGQTVINRLNTVFDDVSNAKWTNAKKLEALNLAIDDAWPYAKNRLVDTSQTLVATTFEYTPAPATPPELERGYSLAFVTLTNNPHLVLRRVQQRLVNTTWTVLLPADTASAFSGETLRLEYVVRVARIAAAGDSIELPLDYLWKAAAYHLCLMALVDSAHFEKRVYDGLAARFRQDMLEARRLVQRNDIPQMIKTVQDIGQGNEPGRYGQNIASNP